MNIRTIKLLSAAQAKSMCHMLESTPELCLHFTGSLSNISMAAWKNIRQISFAALLGMSLTATPAIAQPNIGGQILGGSIGGVAGNVVGGGNGNKAAIVVGTTAGVAVANGGLNTGTVVGGVTGGLIGSQIGGGNGNKLATGLAALFGAVIGNNVQQNREQQQVALLEQQRRNVSNQAKENYSEHWYSKEEMVQQIAKDSHYQFAQPCFDQWQGRTQATQPLSNNPQAEAALNKAVYQLRFTYDESIRLEKLIQQANETAQWAVSNEEQRTAQQKLSHLQQEATTMDSSYIYTKGFFLDKASLAASRGYDIMAYKDAVQLMSLYPDAEKTIHYVDEHTQTQRRLRR